MEEVEYIRVSKPLPGVKERCLLMEDGTAESATARCAVRVWAEAAGLSNCRWLQIRPALVRAGISRVCHCLRIIPVLDGIRYLPRPR